MCLTQISCLLSLSTHINCLRVEHLANSTHSCVIQYLAQCWTLKNACKWMTEWKDRLIISLGSIECSLYTGQALRGQQRFLWLSKVTLIAWSGRVWRKEQSTPVGDSNNIQTTHLRSWSPSGEHKTSLGPNVSLPCMECNIGISIKFYQSPSLNGLSHTFLNEFLPQATGDDVKIYLYGLSLCTNPNIEDNSIDTMSKVLSISESDLKKSFSYWQDMGLVQIVSTKPLEIRFLPPKAHSGSLKIRNKSKYTDT